MQTFENSLKIRIKKNSKIPVNKWKNKKNRHKYIDSSKYNIGLLTGSINDIIVLDIDIKDNGFEEWKKYTDEFNEPLTLKQKSPSGGFHFFFKYNSSNDDDNYLIKYVLTNRSKFRNKGIDLRTNGGYILIAPSSIDDNSYEFLNNNELLEMPNSLINWLLFDSSCKVDNQYIKPTTINTDFVYNIDENYMKELLIKLNDIDDTYTENNNKWLIMTSILKSLDYYKLWDDWSTQSEKYNKSKNVKIWDYMTPYIDVNFIINKINKFNKLNGIKELDQIQRYKKICHIIDIEKYNMEKINMNKSKINITDEQFNNHNTLILQSGTGTGKTYATAEAISKYNNNLKRKKNIISIVSKKSLASQHIKSFYKPHKIELTSYESDDKYSADNLVICVNSLMILNNITDSELNNSIVYIDEITSFLKDITHNETLQGKLKSCYQILMRIIKKCHKLIVSDAIINDNVFNFIKSRQSTIIYIKNEFKNYKNVKAIKTRDIDDFMNKMINDVKNNKYFLCSSDSCEDITRFYHNCEQYGNKEDFILITSDSKFEITDASEQFLNKFVFYSPSIIFGVDFSIEQKQNMYTYNKGSSIDPARIFQQTTRCRNIDVLYYFSELDNKEPIFESLQYCYDYHKDLTTTSLRIHECCVIIDENDDTKIIENSFFNIFVYNEYSSDIYKTNKTAHYELILKDNGFILSSIGDKKLMSVEKKQSLDKVINLNLDATFECFLKNKNSTNETLNNAVNFLNLQDADDETLIKYKDILLDNHKLEEHKNFINCIKNKDIIKNKITNINASDYEVSCMGSVYHKIKIIYDLEESMNIKHLAVDTDIEIINYNDIDESKYKLIKKIFRIERKKPTNSTELLQLYVSMIKNITSSEIITSEKKKCDGKRFTVYNLNNNIIKYHIDLNLYSNPYLKNYNDDIIEKLDITRKEQPINDINKTDLSRLDIDIFVD
jgi:hypothetical protein